MEGRTLEKTMIIKKVNSENIGNDIINCRDIKFIIFSPNSSNASVTTITKKKIYNINLFIQRNKNNKYKGYAQIITTEIGTGEYFDDWTTDCTEQSSRPKTVKAIGELIVNGYTRNNGY